MTTSSSAMSQCKSKSKNKSKNKSSRGRRRLSNVSPCEHQPGQAVETELQKLREYQRYLVEKSNDNDNDNDNDIAEEKKKKKARSKSRGRRIIGDTSDTVTSTGRRSRSQDRDKSQSLHEISRKSKSSHQRTSRSKSRHNRQRQDRPGRSKSRGRRSSLERHAATTRRSGSLDSIRDYTRQASPVKPSVDTMHTAASATPNDDIFRASRRRSSVGRRRSSLIQLAGTIDTTLPEPTAVRGRRASLTSTLDAPRKHRRSHSMDSRQGFLTKALAAVPPSHRRGSLSGGRRSSFTGMLSQTTTHSNSNSKSRRSNSIDTARSRLQKESTWNGTSTSTGNYSTSKTSNTSKTMCSGRNSGACRSRRTLRNHLQQDDDKDDKDDDKDEMTIKEDTIQTALTHKSKRQEIDACTRTMKLSSSRAAVLNAAMQRNNISRHYSTDRKGSAANRQSTTPLLPKRRLSDSRRSSLTQAIDQLLVSNSKQGKQGGCTNLNLGQALRIQRMSEAALGGRNSAVFEKEKNKTPQLRKSKSMPTKIIQDGDADTYTTVDSSSRTNTDTSQSNTEGEILHNSSVQRMITMSKTFRLSQRQQQQERPTVVTQYSQSIPLLTLQAQSQRKQQQQQQQQPAQKSQVKQSQENYIVAAGGD